jgi:predicted DNA-binding transcriptional regulator YafY
MKLERLISIIYKLLNHDVLSASMLAEEFQVSQRTIYRDIDVICAAGIPVVSYQGMKVSPPYSKTIGAEQQHPSLTVNLDTNRTNPDALPYLRKAITERFVVHFDYINAKNERASREIEPIKLHYKYSNWYVYGYCLNRRDYREFRLSRMMDVSIIERRFETHREEIRQEHGFSRRERSDQVNDVVIQVGPEALALAMDHFNQADKQFHLNGSMTMRIPIYRPLEARWLWSILLSLGSGAEVIEPAALRTIMKEQLRNTLQLYEEV